MLASEDLIADLKRSACAPDRRAVCRHGLHLRPPFFRGRNRAVIISRGIRSWPMLKCSSERWVCAPPEHIGRNIDCAKAVHLSANVAYQVAA